VVRASGWVFASLAVALVLVAFACDDEAVPQPCTGVPEHGCPLAHGVACEDPRCQAIYACREGNRWEFVQNCPNYDAQAELPYDAGTPSTTIVDASIDAPPGAYGGPGCEVLQDPDCPVGLALACTNGCCGCEDLFVCTDGEWDLWGECDDGGVRYAPEEP
jgi:hypothetical protein